ncbi:MAG: hypothetical protein EOM74_00865 [Methanomicrobia archaeon]|nr:hypothetical protein [Methanomicrobia archaeon]
MKYVGDQGFKIPLVVKIIDGTQGLGIFVCTDENIFSAVVQYLIKTKNQCIIQKYCDISYDVRVHVFCKSLHPATAEIEDFEIIGAMKREKAPHDFRTNFSVGGKISSYKLNEEEAMLAKQAAKQIGAVWCGVDICYDGITKTNYIIEVNASPALKGITQIFIEDGHMEKAPAEVITKFVKNALSSSSKENSVETQTKETEDQCKADIGKVVCTIDEKPKELSQI